MPVKVQKRGSKFVVTDGSKVFGRHESKSKAERQMRAINANTERKR